MKRKTFIKAVQLGIASTVLYNGIGKAISFESILDSKPYENELAYHRIDEIKFSTVKLNYPRLVGKNAKLDLHGYGPNVDICQLKN